MNVVEVVFWTCLMIIFYTFVGYALLVWVLVRIRKLFVRPHQYNLDFEPEVSLVIPCFNEAKFLAQKVQNCFELDYPKHKLNIIFITDGSDDGSNHYLKTVQGITLMHDDIREGKSVAENRAMQFIKTPFVIFSDANTRLNKEAVREI